MRKNRAFTFFLLAFLFWGFTHLSLNAQTPPSSEAFGPKTIKLDKVGPGDVLGDMFAPVLFRHKYHAQIVKDCSVCHHYFELHYNDQVVPADKCDSCHASENFDKMSRNLSCSVCHNTEASPDIRAVQTDDGSVITIPGLKAAYHRNCLSCHNNMGGPTTCGDCHLMNVPDHSEKITTYEGSATCEKCHPGKIDEVQATTHYRLNNPYSFKYLSGDPDGERPAEIGMINRYGRLWGMLATQAWNQDFKGACKNCHVGYGLLPYTAEDVKIFPDSEYGNVDCLVCHVGEGYSNTLDARLNKNFEALAQYAKKVQHTDNDTCKRCHLALSALSPAESGSPVYSNLRGTVFDSSSDVHAALGLTCFNCHYDRDHMFKRQISPALQAADSPKVEQGCTRCHRDAHLKDQYAVMTQFMACTGCHIPDTGGAIEVNLQSPGTPTQKKSKVVYKWFNRTTDIFGYPYGDRSDGILYQYRVAIINEPLDSDGNILSINPVERKVLGEVDKWREREVYLPISHGVSLEKAYRCSDCHGANSKFDWSSMGLKPPAQN